MSGLSFNFPSFSSDLPVLSVTNPDKRKLALFEVKLTQMQIPLEMVFPLSAAKLAKFCTHCHMLTMPITLSVLTGEEQRLGYFHHQVLLRECQWVLPEPLDFVDFPLLRQRTAFFQLNQAMFQCKSIGFALYIIIKNFEKAEHKALKTEDNQW